MSLYYCDFHRPRFSHLSSPSQHRDLRLRYRYQIILLAVYTIPCIPLPLKILWSNMSSAPEIPPDRAEYVYTTASFGAHAYLSITGTRNQLKTLLFNPRRMKHRYLSVPWPPPACLRVFWSHPRMVTRSSCKYPPQLLSYRRLSN